MKALLVVLAAGSLFSQAKLPQYMKETLPNGTVIAMMPRSGVPLVHFRVLVRGGVESDPRQMAGLANLTASLLRRGTAKRSAEQFAEELDYLGGTFQAAFDGQLGSATAISSEFLSKDFDKGLDLLSDAVLHPAITESEVHKELARRKAGTKAVEDKPKASNSPAFPAASFR